MDDPRRIGTPKTDEERAASHFGVPIEQVSPEMLEHVKGIPRGTGLELGTARGSLTEEQITNIARQAAREVVEEATFDKDMLTHLVPEVHGTPGIVIDEAKAKATPCRCFTYREKPYCYSPGVIGMLGTDQQKVYCPSIEYTVKPGIKERFTKFREAAEEAHKKIETLPKGERLIPWLESMGKELRKRGIEVS